MPQQMNQNIPMMNGGGMGQTPGLPDETRYTMPQDMGGGQGGTWTYGDPNLTYGGQAPSTGVGNFVVSGSTQDGNPDSAPMPIQGMNGGNYASQISSSLAQSQRMKNPVDMESTHTPADNRQAYQASLRSLLDRNVGYFIVATFLVGTQQSVTWQGILHTVGSDYLVLYQPDYERYISCDLYALKFAQFHDVKGVPYCAASQSWQGQSGW